MSFRKTCSRCVGVGYLKLDSHDICPTCNGLGEIELEGVFNDYKTCRPCLGMGYLKLDQHKECSICIGIGLVPTNATTVIKTKALTNKSRSYIHPDRIRELSTIKHPDFDLTRLIRMLEEINSNHAMGNHLSVALLVRAVLDHVPPIFGKKGFVEVANNVGPKSFGKTMQLLDQSSRKIADMYLHTQIRKREALPNEFQVDSSRELDILLGEIGRLLT